MRLKKILPQVYARDVLPLTAPLWAGRRTPEQYAAQTLELAASAYGRRHYATYGLYDGARLVASFKRYDRTLRHESHRLRAIGFGAVFTPMEYRGRGYASFMLATMLDTARSDGYDVAYLFSDIRPHFYAALGFSALPSREFTTIADSLPSQRMQIAAVDPAQCKALMRCFERSEHRRRAAFLREPALWQWIAMRSRNGSQHPAGQEANLGVGGGRNLRAYVIGVRAPELDAYVVDEYGFYGDADEAIVAPLLRAAAGDLRRIVGWLPPDGAAAILSKRTIRRRKRAIFMVAPLGVNGKNLLRAISLPAGGDFCWATDHV